MLAAWQTCVCRLKTEISSQEFNTWIEPLRAVGAHETLHLLAPNRFILEWVKENFLPRIEELLASSAQDMSPRIVLNVADPARLPTQGTLLEQASSAAQPASAHGFEEQSDSNLQAQPAGAAQPASAHGPAPGDSETDGFRQDRQEGAADGAASHGTPQLLGSSPARTGGRPVNGAYIQPHAPEPGARLRGSHASASASAGKAQSRPHNGLNSKYTFDNFIEGGSNQLARAAAIQAANHPGEAYNPLYIYGGVGLGKTHLMHAVGNCLLQKNPATKIACLSSESFMQSMVSAIQLNAVTEFKNFYHSVEVLLIDDVQFLAKGKKSQEQFFHIFNEIFEQGRQIILTCDRYYKEIDLEERLWSRFGWGLAAPIDPPELETRTAILINKASQENVALTSEQAMFMARKLHSNIRELEGALKKVIAHAHFMGSEITLALIKEALKDLFARNPQISIDKIQRIVAEYYNIKLTDMISKRRSRSVARPRQMAMCLSRELTNHSLPEIGGLYGGRDHTTVLHACKTINELKRSSEDINKDYQTLLRALS